MSSPPAQPEEPGKSTGNSAGENIPGESFDLAAALGALQGEPDDNGLSLEDLNRTYAAMLGADDPYLEAEPPPGWEANEQTSAEAATLLDTARNAGLAEAAPVKPPAAASSPDDQCPISPRSIWEAILFVGQPGNQPIRAADVAKLMRGVTPVELEELAVELNQAYEAEDAPYRIVSRGDGFRMELAPECRSMQARMAGKAKEARLSQSQIETLAIVAYHQPLTAAQVAERRGRPSGGVLRQLVRRGLLTLEPGEGRGKERYRTTTRFLQVFHLKGLSDLPQIQDLDRSL